MTDPSVRADAPLARRKRLTPREQMQEHIEAVRLLRPEEAAERLGISLPLLKELMAARRVPFFSFGSRTHRFDRHDLDELKKGGLASAKRCHEADELARRYERESAAAQRKREQAERRAAKQSARLAQPQLSQPGTIYLLKCGRHIKIGFTARSLSSRLGEIQTGAPQPIKVLRELKGTRGVEQSLHHRFRAYRSSGEWFLPKGELAEWIEAGCPL